MLQFEEEETSEHMSAHKGKSVYFKDLHLEKIDRVVTSVTGRIERSANIVTPYENIK